MNSGFMRGVSIAFDGKGYDRSPEPSLGERRCSPKRAGFRLRLFTLVRFDVQSSVDWLWTSSGSLVDQ
jgi:hypothetical protein